MKSSRLILFFFLSKRRIKYRVLLCFTLFTFIGEVFSKSESKCPVSQSTFYAYPESDVFEFEYTYDPFLKTNIDLIDKFLTKDDMVHCEWQVKAKDGHYASVSFEEFQLSADTDSEHGDLLKIYDGQSKDAPLLAELGAGDPLEESYQSSDDRYLYIVFDQGERTGRRHFRMRYKAVERSKDFIIKIAAIVSASVATVGILFLAFKFTRCCRPCRKRCCPDEEEVSGTQVHSERELRPLTPQSGPTPSAPSTTGDNFRNEAMAAVLVSNSVGRNGAATRQTGRPQSLTIPGEEEVEDDGQLTPLPDEPPPSYDDIFGHLNDGDKADK